MTGHSMEMWRGIDVGRPATEATAPPAHRWLVLPVAVVALVGAMVLFGPFGFSFPGDGLDPSWAAVLGEAHARGLRFGTDIIYTGGPLSFIYSDHFEAGMAPLAIGLRLGLAIAFAALLTALAWSNRRLPVGLVAAALLPLVVVARDAAFMALPFLTALLALSPGRNRAVAAVIALGAAAAAVVTLAKFSVFPLAVVSFLMVDGVRLAGRRVPFVTAAYGAALVLLFAGLEGIGSVVPYLRASLDVSAGYTEAMFIAGPRGELWSFLAAAVLLLVEMARRQRAAALSEGAGWTGGLAAAAGVLVPAAFLFMVWKAGFVRQDGHTVSAWGGLAVAALAFACVARSRPLLPLGLAALVLLVALPLVFSFAHSPPPPPFYRVVVEKLVQQLADLRAFAADPAGRLAALETRKQQAWAAIRAKHPLPRLDGSVDVIPSIQSVVLAHGLDYRPRFSIQEFTTYTPALIEANRRRLVEQGPENLLFQPGSIDGRPPSSAEGPSWPDIMRLYRPQAQVRELLLLRRRATALPDLLGPPTTLTAAYKEPVALPQSDDPLMLYLDTGLSLLGRLDTLLYRPPEITATVTYSNGAQQYMRIVPEIARRGFVISPWIGNATDYLYVATGHAARLPRATAITVRTNTWGRLHYGSTFRLTLRPISTAALAAEPLPPALEATIADDGPALLAGAMPAGAGQVRLIPEGLFAHPPADFDMVVPRPQRRLRIVHGIVDAAWQAEGGTEGVCFAVTRRRGDDTRALFERCLDPRRVVADRGRQAVDLPVDLAAGDVLRLSTTCRGNCAWAWAYWDELRFGPPAE